MNSHYHLTLTGQLKNSLKEDKLQLMEAWLLGIVKAINMNVLIAPQTIYCDTPGNEGMTGVVVIDTSHISFHAWDGNADVGPFVRMDVYSCKTFDFNTVLHYLSLIGAESVDFTFFDRSDDANHVILARKKGLKIGQKDLT